MAEVKPIFLDATTGFPIETDPAADSITLGGLTMAGDIAMGGTNSITGLADGVNGTDAVNKNQLDALSAGLDLKEGVRLATAAALDAYTPTVSGIGHTLTASANGALTVDGVLAAVGDRILVKDENVGDVHVDHGIYDVTVSGTAGAPWVLTRSTDADGTPQGEISNGTFAFVDQGVANEKSGWAVATPSPIYIDTTPFKFGQFQGLPQYTWDAGLTATSNSINIELHTGADAQGTGADGGNSGLEFDVTGVAGQLRVKVDPAQGIQRLAGGLGLELDGTTLTTGAGGVSVLGVPLNFEINGVATSANVTGANIDELTGGGATTLHTHAGAGEAERIENAYTTDGSGVSIGDPVYVSADDVVTAIDAGNDTARKYIGIAKTTVGAAATVDVISAGVAIGVIAGATAGDIYYAAIGGGLTSTRPTGVGKNIMVIGKAKNATDLAIEPQYLGKL